MAIRLGLEAKLYYNAGTYGSPSWVEMSNAKDVTFTMEAGEADVTTRAAAGWKSTVATLKDASIEFELVWDTEDAGFTAIQTAFFANTSVEFAVMDGSILASGSQGLRATMSVTKFSRKEPLTEAITVDCTLKPTYAAHAPEWLTIA